MASRISAGVLSVIIALGLSACGEGGGSASPAVTQAAGNEATQQKMSLYIEGFNALIDDTWGIPRYFTEYQELDIQHASPSATLRNPSNITHLEGAIEKLKEARASRGGDQGKAADDVADRLIPRLEALLAQWRTLDPYFEARAYREDNLAKAKAADAALTQAYQGSVTGIEELEKALSDYQRATNAARLEAMRKAGHAAEASTLDAMQKADFFANAVIEANTAEADRLLPEMEAAVAKLREEQGKLPADNPNKSTLNSIADDLTGMIGYYRDFKQSPAEIYQSQVVARYNSAVGSLNDVELPA
jgi:hypothetical protein